MNPTSYPSPLIAVDVGNTFVKFHGAPRGPAVAAPDSPRPWQLATSDLLAGPFDCQLNEFLQAHPADTLRWLVGSVHDLAERRLASWVARTRPSDAYRRLAANDLPLTVSLPQPEMVGVDRLLGAVAANQLRAANRPAIVIDAGSAVTVDAIAASGAFLGGAILPGIRIAAESLSRYAERLPLVDVSRAGWPAVIGRCTREAMHSGLAWGTLGAVRELCHRMTDSLSQHPQVFISGGDSPLLAPLDGPDTHFVPQLVLRGIVCVDRFLCNDAA